MAGIFGGLTLVAFGGGTIVVLLVVFVTQVLHASAGRFGAIISLISIGSIVGAVVPALLQRRLARNRLLPVSLVAVGGSILCVAYCRSFVLFAIVMVFVGFFQTVLGVVLNTWLMQVIPSASRGRIFAADPVRREVKVFAQSDKEASGAEA